MQSVRFQLTHANFSALLFITQNVGRQHMRMYRDTGVGIHEGSYSPECRQSDAAIPIEFYNPTTKVTPKDIMYTSSSHRVHQLNLQTLIAEKAFSVRTNAVKTVALALASTSSALLLLVSQASAGAFSFSTGDPDGKIGTLSRPSSPGKIQTETADDFILSETTLINQATFTGLLPAGAPLTSIGNVEIEIYHVFPNDSANPPSGNVPARANSPGDVEIGTATRDGADGSLSFTPTILNPSFSVANSVVDGIKKSPNQKTNGEGPVTGEEVSITVTFNPPILLPADHYFFRPEVLLSDGNFLWLSAPKPTSPPLFTGDLQSWTRNDDLAPDWLRIGTDITAQGPFNAAFSLSGETDADADGVPDSLDLCPNTPQGAVVNDDGCSIDQLAPCAGPASGGVWKNHGQYVSTVAHVANDFLAQGLISEDEKGAIVAAAAQSKCGAKAR